MATPKLKSKSILFFDDSPLDSENKVFLLLLREYFDLLKVQIVAEKTIVSAEKRLRTMSFEAVILDVMSEIPRGFRTIESGEELRVLPTLAGVEVLRRCRAGYYGKNQMVPIFMRTARGEPHIRRLCNKVGCSGFFNAGLNDYDLIEKLMERIG